MVPEFIGAYKTKLPKIDRTEISNKYLTLQYVDCKYSVELAERFGYKARNGEANGFIFVKHHIEPHTDNGGRCLVHLAKGKGSLYVLHKGALCTADMREGDVWLFNDKREHFWLSEKPCTLLVVNVKR